MEYLQHIQVYFPLFLLIFARVSAFLITMPIISYRTIPNTHKIGLAFFLAVSMTTNMDAIPLNIDMVYLLLVMKEVVIGLVIGLFAYMIISGIQIAGGLIDFQMGFAMANVLDPQTGAQVPLMGQYLNYFTWLMLLTVDAHHLLFDGIYYSTEFMPITQFTSAFGEEGFILLVVKSFSAMFVIAFQMALPIVGSVLLVDIAIGILGRTVPQLNLFVVGYPVKIFVSFVLLIVTMSTFFIAVEKLFELMILSMRAMMKVIGGA
ncbi:flagellar biosynthetic protein FliR [Priestia taiwanensis]|uniref:Flagellar biosynthetic protein FliR n=1 Tax=Priestia taiwanensis TaxID=1347902 RepID=A0A917EQ78_9BACI|nr:flagellar biosynthetic protein FliR [Priestia taiwanensis]MBM7362827.1 flagellar biosynthetic protein FliR [Priestia taiwanensis]GGE65422.1 flagellar biosynthetic protein FliR [Priestia taiwanensis]